MHLVQFYTRAFFTAECSVELSYAIFIVVLLWGNLSVTSGGQTTDILSFQPESNEFESFQHQQLCVGPKPLSENDI